MTRVAHASIALLRAQETQQRNGSCCHDPPPSPWRGECARSSLPLALNACAVDRSLICCVFGGVRRVGMCGQHWCSECGWLLGSHDRHTTCKSCRAARPKEQENIDPLAQLGENATLLMASLPPHSHHRAPLLSILSHNIPSTTAAPLLHASDSYIRNVKGAEGCCRARRIAPEMHQHPDHRVPHTSIVIPHSSLILNPLFISRDSTVLTTRTANVTPASAPQARSKSSSISLCVNTVPTTQTHTNHHITYFSLICRRY